MLTVGLGAGLEKMCQSEKNKAQFPKPAVSCKYLFYNHGPNSKLAYKIFYTARK